MELSAITPKQIHAELNAYLAISSNEYSDNRLTRETSIKPESALSSGQKIQCRLYECHYCPYKSKYRADVCKHQSRKHKDQPRVVSITSRIMDTTGAKSVLPTPAMSSMKVRLPGPRSQRAGRMECDICFKFGTYSTDKFYIHMAAHHNLKPFKCSFCGQRANYKSDVQKHIRNRKKYEPHEAVVEVLPEEEAKATIDMYILERHRHSSHRRKRQPFCAGALDRSAELSHPQKFIKMENESGHKDMFQLNHLVAQSKVPIDVPRFYIGEPNLPSSMPLINPLKQFKCAKCFYRGESQESMRQHIAQIHQSVGVLNESYHDLGNNTAMNTLKLYESTFGTILNTESLCGFILYENLSFDQLLQHIAGRLLEMRQKVNAHSKGKQIEQMFLDYFRIYTAYYPERYEGIMEISRQVDVFIHSNKKKTLSKSHLKKSNTVKLQKDNIICSFCKVRIDCALENQVDHLGLHLQGGAVRCTSCNYTTTFYKLAILHNNRAHRGTAKMQVLDPL
ncbi:hypothetical protein ACOME3_010308 [Neoechinorhynchus agilis]